MNQHERKATEAELARLRARQQQYLTNAASKGAPLYALFCPSCNATQLTTAAQADELTAICSCCAAIFGVRNSSIKATLCLFEPGIKPEFRA
ncbi:hypothetical protein SAMN05660691_01097 [Rheinheimera pacifica]|uniref:Uncharacterized protein n=1 Tax=Rheinheimera pacifica TaxID=173990 RepID=A0A1H6KCJ2_9GAMM|nr:hypothetical protein [Rheinheimera pacifica]SEH73206.1 hypothetical protein SAMN05660691_01097 [Rheinheimera pacifica]